MGEDLQGSQQESIKIHPPDNIPCFQLYFEGYALANCVFNYSVY